MRKALIVFILILALALGGGAFVIYDAAQPRDEVLVSENLRYGDTSAAEGLSLTMYTNFDDHLFWDISYIPCQPEKTENDYRISVKKDYGDYEYEPIGIHITNNVESWRIESYEDADPAKLSGLAKAYHELWQQTPAGCERDKQIFLKDYYDYYPIECELYTVPKIIPYNPDLDGIDNTVAQQQIDSNEYYAYASAVASEYFKIPVMEDEKLWIHLRKDENGDVRGLGSGSGDFDAYNLWAEAVVLNEGVYFIINNRSNEGKIVDTSLIPGGYGIYFIPHVMVDGETALDMEGLSTVKSLDEKFEIAYMFTDEREENIILIGLINTELRMLVIDVATMETLQNIEIADNSESCWQYYYGGDFIALGLDDGRLALVERQEKGEYLLRFVVDDEAHAKLYNRYEAQAWAWNGEKLAVSGYKSLDDMDERFVADFYYAIYDETGLLCFTDCDSSLFVNNDAQWNCVRGNDVNSMKLEWS